MKPDTYEELSGVLKNLCDERTVLQSKVDENNIHIQETQSLNQKIMESEEDDFHIFSPRKYKNIYKDELEQSNIKKTDYETQNNQLLKKIEKLDSLIKLMQDILEEGKAAEKQNEEKQNEEKQTIDNLYENLEHILHKIEISISFIKPDPERAKMELEMVRETLQKILQQNIEESQIL